MSKAKDAVSAYLSAIGKRGGASTSAKKQAAARRNGAKNATKKKA